MATRLYMDHHVSHAITLGLRLRKVDVLTAYEDGARARRVAFSLRKMTICWLKQRDRNARELRLAA